MLSIYDTASLKAALARTPDPQLHGLLAERIANLQTAHGDLSELTHFLVIDTESTEEEIEREVGFSPLINPTNGARFGTKEWAPWHDYAVDHGGWTEVIFCIGNCGFAYVLFIADNSAFASFAKEAVR